MAILLFRIPQLGRARTLTAELEEPFRSSAASSPFEVPSVRRAAGYSVTIAKPVSAVEQIVVFRAGQYVALAELASSQAASNPAALSPTQAISVSYQRSRSSTTAIPADRPTGPGCAHPAVTPSPAPAPPAPTTAHPSSDQGSTVRDHGSRGDRDRPDRPGVNLALIRRSRRRSPAMAVATGAPAGVDPWAPGGIFPDTFEGHRPERGTPGTGRLHRPANAVPGWCRPW